MNRRPYRWVVLAMLMFWQLGVLASGHAAALASLPGGGAHAASAHCEGHSAPSLTSGASDSHSPGLDVGAAKSKPDCCGHDACKCGGAPAALIAVDPAPLALSVGYSTLSRVPDSPAIRQRSSDPFRPPI